MKKNNALAHVENKLVLKTCCYFIFKLLTLNTLLIEEDYSP